MLEEKEYIYLGPLNGGKAVISTDENTPEPFKIIYSSAVNTGMEVGDTVKYIEPQNTPNKEHAEWKIIDKKDEHPYRIGVVTKLVYHRLLNYYALKVSFGSNKKPIVVTYRGDYQPLVTDSILVKPNPLRGGHVWHLVHNIGWCQRLCKLADGKVL